MGIKSKDYRDIIKNTDACEDYEFSEDTVSTISKAIDRYVADIYFEKQNRSKAGKNAKTDLTNLIKAIDNFLPKLRSATTNNYILTPLFSHFFNGPYNAEIIDDGKSYQVSDGAGNILSRDEYRELSDKFHYGIRNDLERLKSSAEEVLNNKSYIHHPTLPQFPQNAPRIDHKRELIKRLGKSLEPYIEAKSELTSTISSLLIIINIKLSGTRIAEILYSE